MATIISKLLNEYYNKILIGLSELEDICAFAQGLLYIKNMDDTVRKESLYHLQHECEALSK